MPHTDQDDLDIRDTETSPTAPSAPPTEGHPFAALLPLLVAAVVVVALGLGVTWFGGASTTTATSGESVRTESDATRIPRLQEAAEDLAGTDLPGPVSVSRLDRDDLVALIQRLSDEDPDPTQTAGYDDLVHLMGVLEPGQNLASITKDGLADQAAGLYDPKSDRLYLVERGGADVTDSTIVHEIVHAIQDRKHPLEDLMKANPSDEDAVSAVQSVIEGEATEVQTRFLQGQGASGILGELSGSLNQLSNTQLTLPPYLQRSLEFPYTQGSAFITALRAKGGQAAVDRAFADPPRTTLAVMEPERYLSGRDEAVAVSVPAVPEGQRRVVDTTFGASELWALTNDHSLALAWHGGRVTVDRAGDRGTLTLRVATDEPRALAAKLAEVLPSTTVVTVDGDVVTAVNSATLGTSNG